MDILIIRKDIDLSLFLIVRCSVFLVRFLSVIAIFNLPYIFSSIKLKYKNGIEEDWMMNRKSHLFSDIYFLILQAIFLCLFVIVCIYTDSVILQIFLSFFDISHFVGTLSASLYFLKLDTKKMDPRPLSVAKIPLGFDLFLERQVVSVV
jgi:hypothetical protein